MIFNKFLSFGCKLYYLDALFLFCYRFDDIYYVISPCLIVVVFRCPGCSSVLQLPAHRVSGQFYLGSLSHCQYLQVLRGQLGGRLSLTTLISRLLLISLVIGCNLYYL